MVSWLLLIVKFKISDDTAMGKSSWFSSTTNIMQDQTETTKSVFSWLEERRKNLRSWTEFFQLSKFGFPSVTGAVPRVKKNFDTFLTNYLCVFIVLLVTKKVRILNSFLLDLLYYLVISDASYLGCSWWSSLYHTSKD